MKLYKKETESSPYSNPIVRPFEDRTFSHLCCAHACIFLSAVGIIPPTLGMARPILVVHTIYTNQPVQFFPWRLFQTSQAKRLAKNPSVRYIVMGQLEAKRSSKAFLEKHSKKSGLLQAVPNAKNVFTIENNTSPK